MGRVTLRVARFEDNDTIGTRLALLDTLEKVVDNIRDCYETDHIPRIESVSEYRRHIYACCLNVLESENYNLR